MLAGGELQLHCFVASDLYVLQGRSMISGEGQEAEFSSPPIFNFIFVAIFKMIFLF